MERSESIPAITGAQAESYANALGEHAAARAALARATRPHAAWVARLSLELDLADRALCAVLIEGGGAPDALAYWLGEARRTARAVVFGRPSGENDCSLALEEGRWHLRWTEAGLAAPLSAAVWWRALAVAWTTGDEELADALSAPRWVDALPHHPSHARIPSRHRQLLSALLAQLTRGADHLDAGPLAEALEEDIRAPEVGPEGMSLSRAALETQTRPLVHVLTTLTARPLVSETIRAGLDALAAAMRESAMPAGTLLLGLGHQAQRLGVADPLPAALLFEASASRSDVRLEVTERPSIPPLVVDHRTLGTRELGLLREALATATDAEAWQRAARAIPSAAVLRHLLAHDAWTPISPLQARAAVSALAGSASIAELLRLPSESIDPAIVVRGLSALHREDLLAATLKEALPPLARAMAEAPELVEKASFAEPIQGLVQLVRAIGGAALDERQVALALDAVSTLLSDPMHSSDVIVVASADGTVKPVGREPLVAALERVAGSSWRTRITGRAATLLAPPAPVRSTAIALAALVRDARRGAKHDDGALSGLGPGLLTELDPLYDGLVDELRRGGPDAVSSARAAMALCRLAAAALRLSPRPLSDHEARYLMREPLVLNALSDDERAAAVRHLRAAREQLVFSSPHRVVASWVEAPAAPAAPAPSPEPTSPRRRRIVS